MKILQKSNIINVITLYLSIVVISSGGVFLFSFIKTEQAEIKLWVKNQENIAISVSNKIFERIFDIKNDILLVSKMCEFEELSGIDEFSKKLKGIPPNCEKEKRLIFDRELERNLFLNALYIITTSGNTHLVEPYSGQAYLLYDNYSFREYFKKAEKTKKPVISESIHSGTGHISISIFVPILNKYNEIKYYIGGLLYLDDFSNLLQKNIIDSLGNNTTSEMRGYVFDQNGISGTDSTEDISSYEEIKKTSQSVRTAEGHVKNHSYTLNTIKYMDPVEKKEMLGTLVELDFGWKILLSKEMDSINLLALNDAMVFAGIISLIFILCSLPTLIYMITVTKRREKLEMSILDHAQRLEVTNQELESFSYSVSHDLRSPLRSIDGFSLALLEDYSDKIDDKGKDYLNRVRGSAVKMNSLINDILNLSRVTRKNIEKKSISLSKISKEITSGLMNKDPNRFVDINIQENLDTKGDYNLIFIMMENLLYNAWKFTSKKPQALIEVGCDMVKSNETGETVFYVKDNGAGFDQKVSDKMFDAFQRLHSNSEFEGTGIGLATVKRIVSKHQGNIWANGKVGEGATFYFYLG